MSFNSDSDCTFGEAPNEERPPNEKRFCGPGGRTFDKDETAFAVEEGSNYSLSVPDANRHSTPHSNAARHAPPSVSGHSGTMVGRGRQSNSFYDIPPSGEPVGQRGSSSGPPVGQPSGAAAGPVRSEEAVFVGKDELVNGLPLFDRTSLPPNCMPLLKWSTTSVALLDGGYGPVLAMYDTLRRLKRLHDEGLSQRTGSGSNKDSKPYAVNGAFGGVEDSIYLSPGRPLGRGFQVFLIASHVPKLPDDVYGHEGRRLDASALEGGFVLLSNLIKEGVVQASDDVRARLAQALNLSRNPKDGSTLMNIYQILRADKRLCVLTMYFGHPNGRKLGSVICLEKDKTETVVTGWIKANPQKLPPQFLQNPRALTWKRRDMPMVAADKEVSVVCFDIYTNEILPPLPRPVPVSHSGAVNTAPHSSPSSWSPFAGSQPHSPAGSEMSIPRPTSGMKRRPAHPAVPGALVVYSSQSSPMSSGWSPRSNMSFDQMSPVYSPEVPFVDHQQGGGFDPVAQGPSTSGYSAVWVPAPAESHRYGNGVEPGCYPMPPPPPPPLPPTPQTPGLYGEEAQVQFGFAHSRLAHPWLGGMGSAPATLTSSASASYVPSFEGFQQLPYHHPTGGSVAGQRNVWVPSHPSTPTLGGATGPVVPPYPSHLRPQPEAEAASSLPCSANLDPNLVPYLDVWKEDQ